jgi:peptidoglycan/LPS O-acetylase OafA/YrhL
MLAGAAVGLAVVHKGSIDQGSIASSFPVGAARTVFGFCVGVLVARLTRTAPREESNLKVLVIVSVAGIALAGRPAGEIRAIWDATCVLAVFPLLVYCATLVDPGQRLRRVATFLGVTSYAVYVLHSPLASLMNSAARHFATGAGAPYSGVAVIFVLLSGCWLLDLYFDVPIRRQLARLVPNTQRLRAQSWK